MWSIETLSVFLLSQGVSATFGHGTARSDLAIGFWEMVIYVADIRIEYIGV